VKRIVEGTGTESNGTERKGTERNGTVIGLKQKYWEGWKNRKNGRKDQAELSLGAGFGDSRSSKEQEGCRSETRFGEGDAKVNAIHDIIVHIDQRFNSFHNRSHLNQTHTPIFWEESEANDSSALRK